jgi:SAM-dependent methyltransferase
MTNVAKISDYWDNRENTFDKNAKRYWYQHPVVLKHYRDLVVKSQEAITKKPINLYLQANYPNRVFENALSIGCGSAHKEMQMVLDGIVGKFDLYELSGNVIKAGESTADNMGIRDKIQFYKEDIFSTDTSASEGQYDLVHWDNALHHMFSVKDAIRLSRRMLKPGGVLVIDDYVGPSYMQVSEEVYKFADSVRSLLEEKYLKNNTADKDKFPLLPKSPRIPVQAFLDTDPSEMADAGNILPEIYQQCTGARVIKTGGVLYFLGLRPLFGNFDENNERDVARLKSLLSLDEWFTNETGHTFHAFICWDKPAG